MSERKITVWWEIPCKSAIPVFEGLSEEADMNVTFIAAYDLSERRRKLGWETTFNGNMESRILIDHDWKTQIDDQLADPSQFHIVNGIYQNERIRYLVEQFIENDCCFGVIMEAPSNLDMGWKRLVRNIVAPIITPMRTKKAARHASFILSASGDRQSAFERLGFDRQKIFPFGYFPDFSLVARSGEPATSLKILCIGWLKPYKGQDFLLKAIAELRAHNIPASCIITGFGSSEEALKALHRKLELEELVEFTGVVDNQRLFELFKWSNVLVAPGFEEPWGIRVNEALLSGLPVVVSDGIGASSLVEASGAGEIFKAGSARSLTAAFERYYSRISVENDVFETAKRYRNLIEPRSAGRYVAEVIRYVDQTDKGSAQHHPYPVPAWLDQAVRISHYSH